MDQSTDKSLFVPGSLIGGRYEVLDSLGSGGMGTVVRVIDRALNNEVVALKLLYPHMAKDQVSFARFRNEVLIARKLAHPNIVRLYDFGAAGQGYYYISMEYVEGGSLSNRIYGPKEQRPNFQECLEILHEICLGLACAHSHGVMHRDLKPDNILLSTQQVVKVSDFGLARSTGVDRGLTATGDTVGTPYYMAPEQLRGDKLDQRVDLYALGIMAFEMVVGRRPFFHESYITLAHMHFKDPIPKFAGPETGIPDWFQFFVERCAAKKREDRFSSAAEAAEIIAYHLNDPGNADIERRPAVLSFYEASTTAGKSVTMKRRAAVWGLVTSALIMTLVGSVFAVRSSEALQSKVARSLVGIEQSSGVDLSTVKELFQRNISEADFLPAIVNGQAQLVDDLLNAGVDPNISDENGVTALHLAVKAKQAEMVERLLAHEVHVNAADAERQTPLHYAAIDGNRPVVERLLAAGAKSGLTTAQGQTALMLAIEKQHLSVATLLIEAGADLNYSDSEGNTALHYAGRAGEKDLFEQLVNAGAQTAVTNKKGEKPSQLAPSRLRRDLELLASNTRTILTEPKRSTVVRTRLRERGEIVTEYVGSKLRVRKRIFNSGEAIAEGVQVELQLPNGSMIRLEGPQQLDPKQDAEYSAFVQTAAIAVKNAKLSFSCTNCLR